jgi:3-hydroxybutyrate dehydrogenase
VEEVARMALYLAGPGSGGVNGAALSVDGGWLAA